MLRANKATVLPGLIDSHIHLMEGSLSLDSCTRGRCAQHSRAPIKAMLLDQKRIAGVGNIYADEALFRARIHPLRLANRINRKQAAALRDAIVETLELGHRVQGRHDRRLPRPRRGQRLVPGPLPDPPARGRAVRALRPAGAEAARGGAGDLRVRELPAAA